MVVMALFCACATAPEKVSAVQDAAGRRVGDIPVGGASLHYEAIGHGDLVILIHGGFLAGRMWDPQMEVFAKPYRVVRYDVRGYGRSASEARTFSHVGDLSKLLTALEIEKAILVGLSLGGGIATDFTLEHPEMVSALVLAAPGIGGFDENSDELEKLSRLMRDAHNQGDIDLTVEYFQQAWNDGPRRSPFEMDSDLRERLRKSISDNVARWNPDLTIDKLDPPARRRLSEIRVPVLAVVGDLDMPDIIDMVAAIERDVPGASTITIPGVAHMVNMEKPDEFNRVVLEFLAKRLMASAGRP